MAGFSDRSPSAYIQSREAGCCRPAADGAPSSLVDEEAAAVEKREGVAEDGGDDSKELSVCA